MIKDTKKTKINDSGTTIIPLGDRVLIKENTKNAESKTVSGIIIPITVNEEKGSKKGEVLAVGDGRFEEGKLIPMTVKKGDTVLFQWGDKIISEGEEYYIVKESEILALIK